MWAIKQQTFGALEAPRRSSRTDVLGACSMGSLSLPLPLGNPSPKSCEQCGISILPNRRLSKSKRDKQRFCSHRCANDFRTPRIERSCQRCGQQCERRTGESAKHFAAKKFCSRRCANRARGITTRYRKITVNGRSVLEHRYVMEQQLGRTLHSWETVHHKNGRRLENVPDNLELWAKGQPAGQRVADLVRFVVTHYREEVEALLASEDQSR